MAAAAGLVVLAWFVFGQRGAAVSLPTPVEYLDSVAVMPFEISSGQAELEHVGIGITEDIISRLARIPPLKVISRHSVQAIGRQNLTYPQLGNLLNVHHIVEGAIEIEDDHIAVTLQHIDAPSNREIWTEVMEGSLDDLAEFQETVASHATERFVSTIPGLDLPGPDGHADAGPGRQAYLNGTRALGLRTADGLSLAMRELTRAIDMNPGYAPAYADLSSAYALALFYRYDIGGADGYLLAARALAYAERALALDPDLAAGFAARGYLWALIGQDADTVASDFDRAIELQPNTASIPSWRARSLAQLGDEEAAFSEAARAVELDPLAPGRHIALAELSLKLGRYDQAIDSARSAAALAPEMVRSRAIEARALLLNGDPERCAALPLGPHRVLRATCLRASGRRDEADAIVSSVLESIRNDRRLDGTYTEVIAFEDLAVEFAMRGDARNALFWSARAYSSSPVGIEIRILESALFDGVRDDPEFERSIRSIREDLAARVRRDSERFR